MLAGRGRDRRAPLAQAEVVAALATQSGPAGACLSVAELGPFVLATTNVNKAREIRGILPGSGLDVELLDRPAGVPEVEETERRLLGNALPKATTLARPTGLAAIAEDTGIEVSCSRRCPGGALGPLRR